MELHSRELIKQYFLTIREKHPNLSFSDVEQMCKTPFHFLSKVMEKGLAGSMRLKYLGIFVVHYRKAKTSLKNIDKAFEDGYIQEPQYSVTKASLIQYLKNHKRNDKDKEYNVKEHLGISNRTPEEQALLSTQQQPSQETNEEAHQGTD